MKHVTMFPAWIIWRVTTSMAGMHENRNARIYWWTLHVLIFVGLFCFIIGMVDGVLLMIANVVFLLVMWYAEDNPDVFKRKSNNDEG